MKGSRLHPLAIEATVILTVFVVVPIALVVLNEACGWPHWESSLGRALGLSLMVGGAAVSLYCWRVFSRIGRGTPVPTDPPKHLVTTGLYRYSRNPMYVGHASFFFGFFLFRGELALLLYAALYFLTIRTFVVRREEPDLHARFGVEYDRYTQSVPRWLWMRSR